MQKLTIYALRSIAIAAVLASLSLVIAPESQVGTPYSSAISTVALGTDALAAPCSKVYCSHGSRCVSDPQRKDNCRFVVGGCQTIAC